MRKPANPVCDFCSCPTPDDNGRRTHLAKPFQLTLIAQGHIVPINFTEEWLACPDCDKMIREGNKEGLLERAKQPGIDTTALSLIHGLFWKNKR